jgi:hypothetical protein
MGSGLDFAELSAEQRRQLIDAQQVFSSWRPLSVELSGLGGLYWNTSKGARYLYRKRNGVRTPLGRETPELAQRKQDEDARARRLRSLVRPLAARMAQMAPVNRALQLGRLPTLAAEILRLLDQEALLGNHLIVAGTNALFAYEVAAGVVLGGEHIATGDADLLWDSRRFLELAGSRVRRDGIMGLLRSIDDSFEAHYGFNATNSKGYIVDLICPEIDGQPPTISDGPDLSATPMTGAQWLLDAPRFEQVIIGADGLPLRIVVPEPRTFALHKLWLSRRTDRQPLKRPRDEAQARIVAELARKYFGLAFKPTEMSWLPKDLSALIGEIG